MKSFTSSYIQKCLSCGLTSPKDIIKNIKIRIKEIDLILSTVNSLQKEKKELIDLLDVFYKSDKKTFSYNDILYYIGENEPIMYRQIYSRFKNDINNNDLHYFIRSMLLKDVIKRNNSRAFIKGDKYYEFKI